MSEIEMPGFRGYRGLSHWPDTFYSNVDADGEDRYEEEYEETAKALDWAEGEDYEWRDAVDIDGRPLPDMKALHVLGGNAAGDKHAQFGAKATEIRRRNNANSKP